MTSANPEPPPSTPPLWPHCGHNATQEHPVGCHGIRVPGHTTCLAHLDEADCDAYLATLAPGADIDHRSTPFTEDLLARLLDALRDPGTEQPRIGSARFDGASFTGPARFDEATFTHVASFDGATFTRAASFDRVTFSGLAAFNQTTFTYSVWFDGANFTGAAAFGRATFTGAAHFRAASFTSAVQFPGATFTRDATFIAARFEAARWLGPLVCGGAVNLDHAVFEAPVTMMIAARELSLRRTRWVPSATLRLRCAEVGLAGAVMECPVTVAGEPVPFPGIGEVPLSEEVLAGRDTGVRVREIGGVDAAHLALTDVDLSECRFVGAVHLDQLRMDGRTTFARPPIGWHRCGLMPLRWSRRRTLAEEHQWRAATVGQPTPGRVSSAHEWQPGPHHPDLLPTPGPETLAALYRQLRKALEDGKNEPGAADFYYGECEMRRHDRTGTPWAERALLTMYWAASGYGLRASRALTSLAAAMLVTVAVMMLWGLPTQAPKRETTGRQVVAGQTLALTTDTPDPVNPTGPWGERVTTGRFERALRVTVNSVIFRSSGQDLTTAGAYTEMTSRLAEPVLLGLAVLAVRSRVKR
ncbi:pentapeptide repeat-containing protein [Streptomyces sioyaensis]|uniref:pentapeptide repeat-containing protein n=1 Tax=Streptomyces sioyaensis TaxID=67364 RepID=UPI001F463C2F|nr:pentapeptide repeat-containing protein [Streptomyces sioyaensis]MCF3173940.1 pentapeptide repeat-containing protein [Streptomyces sioyaensis]